MPAASDTVHTVTAWWEDEAAMQRFVADLVAAELAAMRLTGPALPPQPWPATMHIGRDLGADSLELMSLASALAEALQMHESGIEDYLLVRQTLGEWTHIARTSLSRFSARLTFRTSGSTGVAKSCVHTFDALLQEVQEIAPLLHGTRRIFSTVPAHHIYGFLFTMLLPAALGLAAGDVIDLRGGSAARLAQDLRDGDLVIGHPEFWRAAARAMPVFPAGVTGLSSTAPCPDELSVALGQAGLGALLQIYGSSETAGVGWRNSHDQPYQLFSSWQRGDGAALQRTGKDGVTVYPCQDSLTWFDARRFLPTGRVDQAVQVGGINVFPARVRRELLLHPDVLDASVRLMRADEGNRLKAFIVPRIVSNDADPAGLHAALEAWVSARLTAPERPKAFSFGTALPSDGKGKAADWALPVRAMS